MCGIAGVVELGREEPSADGLRRMAATLRHRGPDADGIYRDGPAGLAHTRLSIIDVSGGDQPMLDSDGLVCVVFNGEIYNFPELRDELEARGARFRTRSDTEVLLRLFVDHGTEAFPRVNGMLAAAFWDRRDRSLTLVRDRLGKKPLFYYRDAQRFLFGSELKALLAYGGIDRTVDVEALHDYLSNGTIAGDHSIIEGVRKLPPGHWLVLRDGRVTVRPYWELHFEPAAVAPPEGEVLERLDGLLREAVRCRLMSEVPLGAFLSGGLDSSAIVALMTELSSERVKTFTIGFTEESYSELDDARAVAEHLGTDHNEAVVEPSAFEILDDLVWYLDEPFGDSSAIPTYYLCREARRHVTVALSGDGGDEVFAGYTRYLEVPGYERMERIPGLVRRGLIRPLPDLIPFTWPGWNRLYAMGRSGPVPGRLGTFPYIRDVLYTPELRARVENVDPFERARRIVARVPGLDPVSRYQYLDTLEYLPTDILVKVDRASMANSLEVRSPLLDHRLVEYMATLPVDLKLRDGVTKHIFRKYCANLLPPRSLAKGKQGFAVPKDVWFRGDLRSFAEERLLDRRTLERGWFRERPLRRLLRHHASGSRDYSDWIWNLIVLETWLRSYVDAVPEPRPLPAGGPVLAASGAART